MTDQETNPSQDLVRLFQSRDGLMFPAAHGGDLALLWQKLRAELGCEAPDDYMSFLRHSDGAVADGVMLYGSQARVIDDMEMPALVDINRSRRAYRADWAHLLQLGEVDDDVLAFDPAEKRYLRLERASGECQDHADSLTLLIASSLAA